MNQQPIDCSNCCSELADSVRVLIINLKLGRVQVIHDLVPSHQT